MDPRTAISRFLADQRIEPSLILLALSGGFDSTAMALAFAPLRESGYRLAAAHVNHHLRGAESEADEQFVRDLCGSLEIPLSVADGTLDPLRVRHVGIEAAARETRYAILERIRRQEAASWIATAHQKNDQAETVLLRLLTGSGTMRLRGISPRRRTGVIRPLLDSTRQEIDAFLAESGVTPRADRSNGDPRYLRNRIRSELLPLLTSYNPRIVDTLAETARQAREESAAMEWMVEAAAADALRRDAERTDIDLSRLAPEPWALRSLIAREVRRLDESARELSAADLRRITSGIDKVRRISLTRDLELSRNGRIVSIRRRRRPPFQPFEVTLEPGQTVTVPAIGARVRMERLAPPVPVPVSATRGRQIFQLPPGADPLFTIRSRRTGDRFAPLGLGAEKKLTDFMSGRKTPPEERDRTPLLVWNGRIVWVAGLEISEAFKVTDPEREAWEVLIEYSE